LCIAVLPTLSVDVRTLLLPAATPRSHSPHQVNQLGPGIIQR